MKKCIAAVGPGARSGESRERVVCKPVRLAAVSMGCGIKGKGKEGRVSERASEGREKETLFCPLLQLALGRCIYALSLPYVVSPPPLGLSVHYVCNAASEYELHRGADADGGRVQQPQMRPRCIENQTTNQTVRHTRLQRARTRERASEGRLQPPLSDEKSISPPYIGG